MGRRIAVAVLALLVVTIAAFIVTRRRDAETRAARSEARLLSFDDRKVTALSVELGGVTWRYERAGTTWRVVAPLADSASHRAVQALVTMLRTRKVVTTVEDPEALASYGLDPPRARVRVEAEPAVVLDLGEIVSTGEGVFARVEGRPGVLVVESQRDDLVKALDPATLRDRGLLGLVVTEVRAISLEAMGDRVALERRPGGWWFTQPASIPASDAAVERLLDVLDKAEVKAFLDDAYPGDSTLGFDSAALTIELTGAQASRKLVLGSRDVGGRRLVVRNDRRTVLGIDPASLAGLPTKVADLTEMRLTKVNRYSVSGFTYTGASRVVRMAKSGTAWKDESGRVVPEEAVIAFLQRALEAPTRGFENASPPGPPEVTLEVDLGAKGSERIEYFRDGRARVASLPDVLYRLAASPPEPRW